MQNLAVISLDFDGCSDILTQFSMNRIHNHFNDKRYGTAGTDGIDRMFDARAFLVDFLKKIEDTHEKCVLTCGSMRQSLQMDAAIDHSDSKENNRALGPHGMFELLEMSFLSGGDIEQATKNILSDKTFTNRINEGSNSDKWSLNKLLLPDAYYGAAPGTTWSGGVAPVDEPTRRVEYRWKVDIVKYQMKLMEKTGDFYFFDDRSEFLDAQAAMAQRNYIDIPKDVTLHLCHFDWYNHVQLQQPLEITELYTIKGEHDHNTRSKIPLLMKIPLAPEVAEKIDAAPITKVTNLKL